MGTLYLQLEVGLWLLDGTSGQLYSLAVIGRGYTMVCFTSAAHGVGQCIGLLLFILNSLNFDLSILEQATVFSVSWPMRSSYSGMLSVTRLLSDKAGHWKMCL